ncbi:MAG: ankyrin repeat domain-containing protein [Bdellovibrionales bacterium]
MIHFLVFLFCCSAMANPQLVKALNEGRVDLVKELALDPKARDYKDSEGLDALFHAVSLGEIGAVKTLLESGANTQNLYQNKKESLLFEASRLGANQIIEILLKKNPALLKIKNSDDETALFEAVRSEQSKTVELLIKKGLSLKEKNKLGKKPADYASVTNKKMQSVLKKLTK